MFHSLYVVLYLLLTLVISIFSFSFSLLRFYLHSFNFSFNRMDFSCVIHSQIKKQFDLMIFKHIYGRLKCATTRVCVCLRAYICICMFIRIMRVWWIQKRVITNHSFILSIRTSNACTYEIMVWQHMWASCQRVQFYISSICILWQYARMSTNERIYHTYNVHTYTKYACKRASNNVTGIFVSDHSLVRRSCASVVYLWILLFQIMLMKMLVCFAGRGGVTKQKFPLDLALRGWRRRQNSLNCLYDVQPKHSVLFTIFSRSLCPSWFHFVPIVNLLYVW